MPIENRIAIVVGLVALATALGLFWKARTGRAKAIDRGELVDLAKLGATKAGRPVVAFGKRITFLQFSSETCSTCKQTSRVFEELEKTADDVLHIEVDITNRLDLAKKFQILQTPTTLVLDHNGRVTSRIGGAPKQSTIDQELGSFVI
jgi:thiol-disulfide isomerase/thioredoxin